MITSKTNKLIKLIKSLEKKKYRDKNNMYILEGRKFVLDAINGGGNIKYIIATPDYVKDYKDAIEVSEEVFDYISTTKTPQGVLAVLEIEYKTIEDIKESANILYLDNLQDSENVGGLIRSSVCADFDGVIITKTTASPFSAKAVRASAGSILNTKIIKDEDYVVLNELKEKGFEIIASTLKGSEKNDFNSKKNVVIVGNEGNGISDECLTYATKEVKIPMSGKCESLNANVSGAILMYKIYGY